MSTIRNASLFHMPAPIKAPHRRSVAGQAVGDGTIAGPIAGSRINGVSSLRPESATLSPLRNHESCTTGVKPEEAP